MNGLRSCAFAYAAGSVGGLANSIAVWLFGAIGITAALGVAIGPALTPPWLYPRLVWGGIWGALLLLPILRRRVVLRGLLFGLGPTIVQLGIVLPIKAQKGMLGLELGTLTPVFVLIFNSVWGIVAAWLYARLRRAGH
ncbi:MAG: hypothetical protein GWN09_09705 [Gammaproteobacteria bacterium]|nr:hypothetical protein [Gammaproteobacteria bacterium]